MKKDAPAFQKTDAFIGFQKDTPASVIFQATNLLRKACQVIKLDRSAKGKFVSLERKCQMKLTDMLQNDSWSEAVSIV